MTHLLHEGARVVVFPNGLERLDSLVSSAVARLAFFSGGPMEFAGALRLLDPEPVNDMAGPSVVLATWALVLIGAYINVNIKRPAAH